MPLCETNKTNTAGSRLAKQLGSISFIEHEKKRQRSSCDSTDSFLGDFDRIANVVEEISRLNERGGKRLCCFQQSGTCRRIVSV